MRVVRLIDSADMTGHHHGADRGDARNRIREGDDASNVKPAEVLETSGEEP
jgi:hypothetical protein